jgi:rubredoxin
MSTLFYFVGFLAGVAVFLYIYSLYHSGKDAIMRKVSGPGTGGANKISIEPGSIEYRSLQSYPRERVCPLCGAVLSQYEALYAARLETGSGGKIMIYGCRFCYKPDEDPDEIKKNEF